MSYVRLHLATMKGELMRGAFLFQKELEYATSRFLVLICHMLPYVTLALKTPIYQVYCWEVVIYMVWLTSAIFFTDAFSWKQV